MNNDDYLFYNKKGTLKFTMALINKDGFYVY